MTKETISLIIAGVIVALYICYQVYSFATLTSGKKKEKVIQWLIYACTIAEQTYGSKTGQLKLRSVWNDFVLQFPFISQLITYERFSELVDEALKEMRKMLEDNKEISDIVNVVNNN